MEHLDFNLFKNAVNKQFTKMSQLGLTFVQADITGDQLWDIYLKAYPKQFSEIFRTRHHYEGNYDKSFIRRVGNLVGIDKDGNKHSLWDCEVEGYFQQVADALSQAVHGTSYTEYFYTTENHAGHKPNKDFHSPEITWVHFYLDIPAKFIKNKNTIGPFTGELRNTREVFERGLKTFTLDAAEQVLELIAQGSLYRGEEHKVAVQNFVKHKKIYDGLKTEEERKGYVYFTTMAVGISLRFRSSVIGTLVEDISNGVDLERAVKSFEDKVAPQNYKRTTALVTPKMIAQAQEQIEELGLTDSLARRFAVASDISVNNVLFTASTKKAMNVFDDLAQDAATKAPKALKKVEEISIEKFIKDVLPTATSIEVLLEGRFKTNLMSLMTAAHPETPQLLKWNNHFSWAYAGDITDSIRENVKKRGGAVEGDLRISLSWYNADDLDLSVIEPTGHEIYYGSSRRSTSPNGGMLDLDMNGMDKHCDKEPVENIIYKDKSRMKKGVYKVRVDQYSKRVRKDEGFVLQIEYNGEIQNFTFEGAFSGRKTQILEIHYDGNKFEVQNVSPTVQSSGSAGQEVWGLSTNTFVPVTMLMNSPNFWDGQTEGNQHVFFILDKCKTPDETRGFFNEFLKPELTPHRKVFELLGAKVKVTPEPTEEQLSGIGFNLTTRNELTVRVTGKTKRNLLIKF